MTDFVQNCKTWKIYRHVSPEGKIYVGRTSKDRLEQRTGKRGQYYKQNERFYSDIQKFGWDTFKHEILETCCTEKESMDLEIKYISMFNSTDPEKGYNKSIGGYPCNMGITEEERKRKNREYSKRWKENNYERYLETRRRLDHSEKTHARKNAWNKTPERRKKRTEYMRKYRAEHPERIREFNRKSREKKRRLLNEQSNSDRHETKNEAETSPNQREMVC